MINAKKEWKFADLYADEGISGTRADKRPGFKRMINDCLAGKIDYIITKSVSRFARNTVDCLDTVRMLKARGIGVFFEEQRIDTLTSDSELYLVIYAGFAQSESESISKNISWTYRKNFEDGKAVFIYKRLLGYKKGENGEPEIVPSSTKKHLPLWRSAERKITFLPTIASFLGHDSYFFLAGVSYRGRRPQKPYHPFDFDPTLELPEKPRNCPHCGQK